MMSRRKCSLRKDARCQQRRTGERNKNLKRAEEREDKMKAGRVFLCILWFCFSFTVVLPLFFPGVCEGGCLPGEFALHYKY